MVRPTAMQKKRLGQETSARDGFGSPLVGIPSTCQLVPSKRSAIRPLPQLPVAWQNRTPGQSTVERELPGRAISGKIDQLPKPTRRAASTEDWPWEGVDDPTTTQTRLPCGQETSPS